MKAMVLAAGRGKRLGELTKDTPKPLLSYQGKALIEHRLFALANAGVTEIVINISYLAEKIEKTLGDGSRYGVKIQYSHEPETGGLEVGGGIKRALSLLGDEPFILTSSDIVTDYPYEKLLNQTTEKAYLVLVDNPPHHPEGDFVFDGINVKEKADNNLTYGSIALIHPDFVKGIDETYFSFLRAAIPAIQQGQVQGEHYRGQWKDVGRPKDFLS